MKINEFEEKVIYSEASGSMAVVDKNIKMKMNEFGLYEETVIDTKIDISDEAILSSPNLNQSIDETSVAEQLYSNEDKIKFDTKIGYYHSLYAGHVLEGDFRENASSGGMGTWIFNELLDKNLIDYVIHVKKNPDSKSNIMFKYDISSSENEIKEGAKTKYYPVEISEVMEIVKRIPGRYAIIGIPSFIYSVRLLAKIDNIINERIKYTIGLVCGHQKSTKFAESMAYQVGIMPGNLKEIDFRYKIKGRPASSYGVKMSGLINGEINTIIRPTTDLFGQNWGWGFFKPLASDFTDDVFNETADIVLGDAWLPNYISDANGNNIVIVRNKEIDNLIKEGIKTKRLKMDDVNSETIYESQASHYRHTHDELGYRLHVKDLEGEWRPTKRVDANKGINGTRKKIQDLRQNISKQSHIQYQEAVRRNNFDYFIKEMTEYTHEYTALYKKIYRKKRLMEFLKMNPLVLIHKVLNRIF